MIELKIKTTGKYDGCFLNDKIEGTGSVLFRMSGCEHLDGLTYNIWFQIQNIKNKLNH